jgi:hypothetical protein
VKVQFTTLHANFGRPLIHPSNNLTYSQLMSWVEIMPRGDIVLWDYCTSEPTQANPLKYTQTACHRVRSA